MEKVRISCGEWGSCFWEIDSSGVLNIGEGTGYSLVQVGDAPWYRYRESIREIKFSGKAGIPQGGRLSYMFCGCDNAVSADLTGLAADGAESLNGMFHSCSRLITIKFGDTFLTGKTRNMSRMFFGCRSLKHLDLSFFDTSSTVDMSSMFEDCESLEELELSSFDTRSLISMSRMFGNCSSLENIDISGFVTPKVTGMSGLFGGCTSLKHIDLSRLDTSNVINMISMFSSCSSLQHLDLSGFRTGRVTDMSWMFCGCTGMEELDISSFDTSGVTDMSYMFFNCKHLKQLDVSGFDVRSAVNMDNMFMYCSELRCLDLSGFDTRNTSNMKDMFKGCEGLSSVRVGENFDFHYDSDDGCSLPYTHVSGGHDLFQWMRSSDGEPMTADSVKSCNAETYYIQGRKFKLSYESNGGTGSMSSHTAFFDADDTPKAGENVFKPFPKYLFKEWNTEKDRSGLSYRPGDEIRPMHGDVVLHAVWAAAPTIARPARPEPVEYGQKLNLRFPYIEDNNGDITDKGLEIQKPGTDIWEKYDPDTIPEVADDGSSIRYYAANFAGISYTEPVKISVCKGHYDMSRTTWSGRRFTYDGDVRRVVLEGLPEGITPHYQGNEGTDAGKYKASVNFEYDEQNYEAPEYAAEHIWEIQPASYDMSKVSWNYSRPFIYDGSEKRIELENLPEGVSAVYYGNHETKAGTYAAKAAFTVEDPANYRIPDVETLRWDILKADYDLSGMHWCYDEPLTYDGSIKRVVLEGIPEGITATYYGNTGIEAGSYEADVALNNRDRRNYNMPKFDGLKWEIGKADYDMSRTRWKYVDEPIYNGSVKSVTLEGLPEGVSAEYDGSSAIDAGIYGASAVLSYDEDNYNKPEISNFQWEIRKAEYNLNNVRWNYKKPYTYDGNIKKIELIGLPEGVTAEYSGNEAACAGDYRAEAKLSAADPSNYENPVIEGISWKIAKGTYDMSNVSWDFDDTLIYDGSEKTVALTGLPAGISAEYEGSSAVCAGTYTASVKLKAADTDNYEQPQVEDCSWRINKARYDMSSVRWNFNEDFTYDGTVKTVELEGLPEGISAEYSENKAVYAADYIASASFKYDCENYEEPMVENCFWKIGKAEFDLKGASWDNDGEFIYDGSEKSVFLKNLPEGITVEYNGNTATDAGTYYAEAVLIPDDDVNYSKPSVKGCSWEILKADADMRSVRWCEKDDFVYDGQPKSLYLEGLPEGVFAVYDGGYEINAGLYQAEASFGLTDEKNYNVPDKMFCSWEIRKADYDMSSVLWTNSTDFAYDGEMKSVVLEGLPEGVEAEYRGNSAVETGIYEAAAVISSKDKRNYNDPEDMICQWEIRKADYDMSCAEWVYTEDSVYDGTRKSVVLEGIPGGLNVRYEGNSEVNAGFYNAEAVFTPVDEHNYNIPAPMTYTWEIHKGTYDMSGIRLESCDSGLIYDGTEKTVYLEGLPDGVTAVCSGDSAVNAGTYTCRAEFRIADQDNYKVPEPMDFGWKIEKANYDMTSVVWDTNEPLVYDGSEKIVELSGVPEGVKVIYTGNRMTDAGEYAAEADFAVDEKNYNVPDSMEYSWIIEKAEADISSVYWEYDASYVYDGTYKSVELKGIPEGMRVSYRGNTGSRAGRYTASAVLRTADPANYTVPEIENCEWEIQRAEYDMSHAEWTYEEPFVYDGTPKSIGLTGLPEGVKAKYIGNTWTDAGEYIADAGFIYDAENYEPPVVVPCIWEISRTQYDMSGAYWVYSDDFAYDGSEKSVHLEGLPEGVTARYDDSTAINAGRYTACADFDYDRTNYEKPEVCELEWQIHKASYDMSHVRWDHQEPFVYDGTEKVVELERPVKHTSSIMRFIRTIIQDDDKAGILPEGVSVRYEGNKAVEAGTYEAVAIFDVDDPDNYEIPEPLPPFEWHIGKGRYDMSRAKWVYDDVPVYDGTKKSVSVAGLPAGVKAICSDNAFTEAGMYTASAVIIVNDVNNYEVPDMDDFQWKIEKGEYDMSHAVWDYSSAFTYDGTEKTVSLTGLPEGVAASLTGNKAAAAGVYIAEAILSIQDASNYNMPVMPECKWKIEKAVYDMSNTGWDYEVPFEYDGTEKNIALTGLPEGVSASYSGNSGTDAGSYTAEAVLSYDENNYRRPSVQKCRWKINRAVYDMSSAAWDYEAPFVYDGQEKSVQLHGLPEGVSAEYYGSRGTDAGEYSAKVKYQYDRTNYYEPESVGVCRWEILKGDTRLELPDTTVVKKINEKVFDIRYETNAENITFSIDDKTIASVYGTGKVDLHNTGSTIIRVSAGGKNYKKIQKEIILMVEE